MIQKLKQILNYVLIGVVGFIPIVIVFQIVMYLQGLLRNFVTFVLGRYGDPLIPIAAFFAAIIVLAYFGRLLKQDRAYLLYFFEKFLLRIPLLGTIYRVSRKLLRLFIKTEESEVREIVYVEYPKDGMWVPAYVTNRVGDCYVLYVPTSPNPTSGFTVMVHKSKVAQSNMNIEEVSSFVISVGVDFAKPDDVKIFPKP